MRPSDSGIARMAQEARQRRILRMSPLKAGPAGLKWLFLARRSTMRPLSTCWILGCVAVADGRLTVDYSRTDYVFVTEHRWRETLTDTVTLRDMHQACGELTDLAIDVGREILQEALGPDYDVADLVKWFQSEGRNWFRESA